MPGGPESLHADEDGKLYIHDLILFTETGTAAASYIESAGEWTIIEYITKTDEEGVFEDVYQELVDVRGYDSTPELMREVILDAMATKVRQGDIDMKEIERELTD